MGDSSAFPGFHNHSYDRDYARPLFRVASFSESSDGHNAASPRGRSMGRMASFKVAPTSRLSQAMSKLSMKKLQQAVEEKSMEDEGMDGNLFLLKFLLLRFCLADECCSEMELMKEKYTKLLLGEDMSGGGKGVCTAVAISNAITNLYGTSNRMKISAKLVQMHANFSPLWLQQLCLGPVTDCSHCLQRRNQSGTGRWIASSPFANTL
jgi:hypothetical protein